MTRSLPNLSRTLFAAVGALLISTLALSAAVLPAVAPLTAQPVL